MLRSRLLWAAGLALALSLGSAARADQFYLGIGNPDISGYPGPYGTVTVDLLTSTTAKVSFDALSQSSGGTTYQYFFGDGGVVSVNVNASSFTASDANETNSYAGFTPTWTAWTSPGTIADFGKFNLQGTNSDGYTDSATHVDFVLTNTSGIWASDSSVLTENSEGYLARAHIFVATLTDRVPSSDAVATGYAINGVPEPSTMAIAGLGALGFVAYGLRRRLTR